MAKKTHATEPFVQMAEMMAKLQELGAEGAGMFGPGWLEKMSEMGSEWMQFITGRLQKDVQFQHDLMQCRNPQDWQQTYTAFMQKAMEDYAAETGKMVELGSSLFELPTKG